MGDGESNGGETYHQGDPKDAEFHGEQPRWKRLATASGRDGEGAVHAIAELPVIARCNRMDT